MNSKKRCLSCKKYRQVETGFKTNFGFFCSSNCRTEYGIKNAKRLGRKAQIKRESKSKVKKVEDLSIGHQLKLTQDVFNKLRRLEELFWFKERGLEPTCISCGKEKGGDQWACGHFKTVGANPELRFDSRNTYLQHNKRCNMELSGDIYGTKTTHGYIKGLKNRFGIQDAEKIIAHCESSHKHMAYHWSELKAIRRRFNVEIRRIEKLLDQYA